MHTIGEILEKCFEYPDDGIIVWRLYDDDLPTREYRSQTIKQLKEYLNDCPNKDVQWDHEFFFLTPFCQGKVKVKV
jgi:hypothetical protein